MSDREMTQMTMMTNDSEPKMIWTDQIDKILLFLLVVLTGVMVLHMVHHVADMEALTWAENAFSTVLGALILILTGRIGSGASGGNGKGDRGSTPTTKGTPTNGS